MGDVEPVEQPVHHGACHEAQELAAGAIVVAHFRVPLRQHNQQCGPEQPAGGHPVEQQQVTVVVIDLP